MGRKNKTRGDGASAVTRAGKLKEKAKIKFENMDLEGAYELYKKGLKILPQGDSLRAEFNSNIAAYFMMKENYNEAIIHCSLALDIVSDYKTKPLFRRARAYLSLRAFEKAKQDVNEVLKREPEHKGAKDLLAEITAKEDDDWFTEFASHVHLYDSDEGEALDTEFASHVHLNDSNEELASSEATQPAAQFEEEDDSNEELASNDVTCLVNCGRMHLLIAQHYREKFEMAIGNNNNDDDVDVEETRLVIDPESEWEKRLNMAKEKFEQAFEIEPESYDVLLCLGEHQYEMVFLNYSMCINHSSAEQLSLFNVAETYMESAFRIWKRGTQSINDLKNSTSNKKEEVFKIRKRHEDACVILGNWASILYDRSELEFAACKDWKRTLDLAIKKYQLIGYSDTQISQLRKDHVSQENTENL